MARNFCFTKNNYSEEDENALSKLVEGPASYIIWGREKGESGTPHLQGYCELSKQVKWPTVYKFMLQSHCESRKGTQDQAIAYCKKDGDFIEFGTPKKQGQRSDLESVFNMARERKRLTEIAETAPSTFMRFHKAVDKVRYMYAMEDKSFTPMEVIVLIGEPGSGKTRLAHEIDPNLYMMPDYTSTLWFDGYDGQETVLFDDFKGGISYTYLLRLLDGYRFSVPVKGGFVWKAWKRVIITTNYSPETWYNEKYNFDALKRRITQTQIISKLS